VIIPSRRRRFVASVVVAAAVVGTAAAVLFARAGLTLSHYDARGHLVVARRIADSLTPGWQQVGAVWLPLPHLLNAIPVQIDRFYQNGASAVVVSIVSFALAAGAIAWIVSRVAGSLWPAAAAAFVFMVNPNLLYLQSTPMTEPLMLGLTLVAVAMLVEWCVVETDDGQADLKGPTTARFCSGDIRSADLQVRLIGIVFALACLTRYEAWPVTVVALAGAVFARRRAGQSFSGAIAQVMPIAVYPTAAIIGFVLFSRIVVGQWFASGFFVPENPALGHPLAAANQIFTGVRSLGGNWTSVVGLVGLIGLAARGLLAEAGAFTLVALAPVAAAAVPWVAFLEGHPHRVRYMVPLLAAQAIGVGAAASRWRNAAPAAAALLMVVAGLELAPSYGAAPMTAEAQWDLPNAAARRQVTSCLERDYDGTTIMASMGSLGHYMQELSRSRFTIRDFLHEGNGDLWLSAIVRARPFAGWVLIEEYAEGGDVLAEIARENPRLLEGFSRVCEGGGVALYRREPAVRRSAG
jgi:hypothetical protein